MRKLLDESMSFYQSAINLQAHRQQMLASNIANADTPNYKARDIDFRSALKDALQGDASQGNALHGGRRSRLALATTSTRHLDGNGGANAAYEPYSGYRSEWQSSVDGNTVNMDVERAAYAENSVHYEASLTFINSLLQGMQRAITGQ